MFIRTTNLDHSRPLFHEDLCTSVSNCSVYFSVDKLIGWDPVNLYLFRVISENTIKTCGICLKLTINTVESRSGVLTVSFVYISVSF